MRLNEIFDNEGAHRPSKRRGRGIGSGLGKTGGRGGKGQSARSGGKKAGFEGGQTPIYRRLPKRGFRKPNALSFNEVTLFTLSRAIASGALDSSQRIDAQSLLKAGVIRRLLDGVRILGKGTLDISVSLYVNHVTAGARSILEAAGSHIEIIPAFHKSEEKTTA